MDSIITLFILLVVMVGTACALGVFWARANTLTGVALGVVGFSFWLMLMVWVVGL